MLLVLLDTDITIYIPRSTFYMISKIFCSSVNAFCHASSSLSFYNAIQLKIYILKIDKCFISNHAAISKHDTVWKYCYSFFMCLVTSFTVIFFFSAWACFLFKYKFLSNSNVLSNRIFSILQLLNLSQLMGLNSTCPGLRKGI